MPKTNSKISPSSATQVTALDIAKEELKRLREIEERSKIFYDDVLPQMGGLCLQDYGNLNKLGLLFQGPTDPNQFTLTKD